jgi:CRISPR-associated protein Cas2
MSLHEPVEWIVTYDIREPRNGKRVFKLLKSRGVPVQYSVFHVHGTQAALCALMRQLGELICASTDDVRAYRVPVDTQWIQLGADILPDGVLLDCGQRDASLPREAQASRRRSSTPLERLEG